MQISYDFHIHSALSPCADDDMTPANIVGLAKLSGLDAVAVSDHNAIGNVRTAMEVGKAYGVTVVPAMELQTQEDVHVLCLFADYEGLEGFYQSISFVQMENNPEIFGNQLVLDEDDNVVEIEKRMLLVGAQIAVENVPSLAKRFGGVAVAAHVDRSENGMVEILGDVIPEYDIVEFSVAASEQIRQRYSAKFSLTDSDAHTLDAIGKAGGKMNVEQNTPQGILDAIVGNKSTGKI